MKNKTLLVSIIFGLLLLMAACVPASAQTTPSKVGNPEAYLTPEQLAKYQSDINIAELEKKVKTYGDWVGVGGEVGIAVREGLTAVVDVAGKFGNTDVGKFTMVLVAWKVVGKDIMKIFLGLVFFIVFTVIVIYSFRTTCIERRILYKNNPQGFWKRNIKEWEIVEPRFGDQEGLGWIRIAHIAFFLIGIGITSGIMF